MTEADNALFVLKELIEDVEGNQVKDAVEWEHMDVAYYHEYTEFNICFRLLKDRYIKK